MDTDFNPSLGVRSKIVQCYKGKFYTREVCDVDHFCRFDALHPILSYYTMRDLVRIPLLTMHTTGITDPIGRPVCSGLVATMYDQHRSQTAWAKTATAFPTTLRWPEPTA